MEAERREAEKEVGEKEKGDDQYYYGKGKGSGGKGRVVKLERKGSNLSVEKANAYSLH